MKDTDLKREVSEELEGNTCRWDSTLGRWIEPDETVEEQETVEEHGQNTTKGKNEMNTQTEVKYMPENEYKARRIFSDFHDAMEFNCSKHWSDPYNVRLKGWTHDGKAIVEMGPRPVMDINPWTVVNRFTYTGTYGSKETLLRSFLKRTQLFGQVRDWLLCVALFRRSGIKGIGDLGKCLGQEFKTLPGLQSDTDDMGAPNPNRTKYAMACARKHIESGSAVCPHCGGTDWEENIMGLECESCHKIWSDSPGAEGWQ